MRSVTSSSSSTTAATSTSSSASSPMASVRVARAPLVQWSGGQNGLSQNGYGDDRLYARILY
eukprot:399266-Heterocapsa_arctica.AAC.1